MRKTQSVPFWIQSMHLHLASHESISRRMENGDLDFFCGPAYEAFYQSLGDDASVAKTMLAYAGLLRVGAAGGWIDSST